MLRRCNNFPTQPALRAKDRRKLPWISEMFALKLVYLTKIIFETLRSVGLWPHRSALVFFCTSFLFCRIWLQRQALEFDQALLPRVWLESPMLPPAYLSRPPLQIRQPMVKPFLQRKFMPAFFRSNFLTLILVALSLGKFEIRRVHNV